MATDQTPRRGPGRPPKMAAAQPESTATPSVAGDGFVIGFDEWAQVRSDALRGAAALRGARELERKLDEQQQADCYVAQAIDHLQRDIGTGAAHLKALERKLDQLTDLVEQFMQTVQQDVLESDTFHVGARSAVESMRGELRRWRRRNAPRRFGPRRWPTNAPAPIVLASRAVAAD